MRFAIIDLGTNTFNLLIAESDSDKSFTKLFNTKVAVKLGEGGINAGYIADVPFQRGINALKQYQQYLLDYNVEQTFAFATSAIRSASNGSEFVEHAKKIAGITITVIDGHEEADLIYHGNKMAVNMSEQISLIMDIGGGSNEFILANNHTIFWKNSYLLGAARLLEKFKPSDPITDKEIEAFNNYLREELSSLFEATKNYPPIELIGSSGAFDSVIDIIAEEFDTTAINDIQTEYTIDIEHYKKVSKKIIESTLLERRHIPGLIEMRIDMIVISFLLIDFMVNEFNISNIRVSTYSLKEGVICKKLGLMCKPNSK
jgi:exopolyphosphatase/guanosine-5'-triphosphate,3'-diphosphate pyrophosphatase